jgi:hypothetical protein
MWKIMRKTLLKFVLCGALLASGALAVAVPANGVINSSGSYEFTGVNYPNLTINADNVTITTAFASNLGQTITIAGDFTINGRSNVTISLRNTTTGANINLLVNGTTTIIGNSAQTIKLTNVLTLQAKGNVYLKNTNISATMMALQANGTNAKVILEKVSLETTSTVPALLITNAELKAYFSQFKSGGNGTVTFAFSTGSAPSPIMEFCTIQTSGTHIIAASSIGARTLYFEGGQYLGNAKNIGTLTNFTLDDIPLASSGMPLNNNLTFTSTGAADIQQPKSIPPDTTLYTGGLVIPNGQSLKLGYSELNAQLGQTAQIGRAALSINNGATVQFNSGATFTSAGSGGNNSITSGGKYASIDLLSGSTATVQNTSFSNYTTALNDQTGATIQNNTFTATGAGSTIALKSTAAGNYSSNSFQTTDFGIDVNSSAVIASNTFQNNSSIKAITVRGGAPVITNNTLFYGSGADCYALSVVNGSNIQFKNNTITPYNTTTGGAGYALNITGGSAIGVGYFINNNFTSVSKVAVNNAAQNTNEYVLKNNYWGANPPSVAQFTGTNKINYENWLASVGGAEANQRPDDVENTAGRSPANGTIYTSSAVNIPLTFTLEDVGYHNGTPLTYRIEYSADSTFAAYTSTAYSATGYPRGSAITHQLAASLLPAGYETYYWRVRVKDAVGLESLVTARNFIIRQPQINLSLQANKTQASAGDDVTYTLSFENPSSQSMVLGSAVITAILPDDVYWDGQVGLSGGITSGMGTVTVRAYSDIAGTAQVASFITTTVTNVDNNAAAWTPALPSASNHTIRRFNITFTTLPVGAAGTFTYRTRVK